MLATKEMTSIAIPEIDETAVPEDADVWVDPFPDIDLEDLEEMLAQQLFVIGTKIRLF